MSKRTEKEEYWKQKREEQQSSGLSQKQYCEQNNLSYSTFQYYQYKLNNKKSSTTKCHPITVVKAASTHSTSAMKFDIKLPNGIACSIPLTATKEKTIELLEVLCRY